MEFLTHVESNENRNQRKRRCTEDIRFSDQPLKSRHDLLTSAHSQSTQSNIKLARRLIEKYSKLKRRKDPIVVTADSSTFVLNLLADYCRFGTAHALKNDSMGALVQGLRHIYGECGHDQTWQVLENGSARGNPLIGNPDLDRLRRAHRVHLARFGNLTTRASPITPEHVCDLAEKFWFGSGNTIQVVDVALHAVLVIGLNLGLRYDEISKLKVDNVSVWSGGATLSLCESIKNSTVQRNYSLREWDGNTDLRCSVYMDPFTALYSWLCIRGCASGPLFCDIRETKAGQILDLSRPWTSKNFTNHFRARLSAIGIGANDLRMFTGHSIKRGSVQLYRSLGLKDEMVMEIIQMSGFNAYANYCEAYNDCSPKDLPRFSNVEDYITHAKSIVEESSILDNEQKYQEWLDVFSA